MTVGITILDRPAGHDDQTLTIRIGDAEHQLHAVWLRDACVCAACRNPATNERLVDSAQIPLDLGVVAANVEQGHLRVELTDGHTAICETVWLRRHLADVGEASDPAAGRLLWDGGGGALSTFARTDLDDPAGLVAWLDTITERGAAVVTGVDPSDDGLRSVARLIGDIRATNYGVTWRIEATIEPVSAVDSERGLLVHTDLPYRDVAPGLQLLLAGVVDVAGGASTLVDGYAVAEQIRTADPAAWRLLTATEFSYPFVRDDVEFHGRAPLIGLRPDGTYFQIRRAPDLAGSPFVDAADVADLYRALRRWTDLIDHPDNEVQVALRPGELLAFDNHRVLHGRTPFALGSSGRRLLHGCYLDIEDLRSRRAVAARST